MKKEDRKDLSELGSALRDRIRSWRAVKNRPRAMPNELWTEAILLARRFGVHPVSKQLEISYTRLKKLTVQNQGAISKSPRLVEVSSAVRSVGGISSAEIELADRFGRRMVIRNADSIIAHSAVSAFLDNGR